jgi:hypothetical protein
VTSTSLRPLVRDGAPFFIPLRPGGKSHRSLSLIRWRLTIVIEVVGLAINRCRARQRDCVDCTGHGSVSSATHLAIVDCCPDVVSNQKRAPFGPLWERDRGADKVAFGKLDAAMTQNIVSGGVMKIEVG